MEEDTAPPRRNHPSPWWHEGHTKLVYEVYQTSITQPCHLTRSSAPPPYAPWYSEGYVIMMEEEEKKLAHLK
jgi:hypothetical protein